MKVCRSCKVSYDISPLTNLGFCSDECGAAYYHVDEELFTCEWENCGAEVYGRPIRMSDDVYFRLCGLHMLLVP